MKNRFTLKTRIKDNPYFFYAYFSALFIGLITLLLISKGDVVLLLNRNHSPFLDHLFLITDNIGEGIVFLIVLLVIGAFRFGNLVKGLSVFLGTGLIIQILKNIFDMPRPKLYLSPNHSLYFVPGVNVHEYLSFPSGHSATAFCTMIFLAYLVKNRNWGALFFVIALFGALTRVYLCQHFFIDIYFGSMIGVFTGNFLMNLYDNSYKVQNSKWYNYSLVDKIFKKS